MFPLRNTCSTQPLFAHHAPMPPSPLHFGTSPGSRPGKDGVLGSKGPEHPRPCCQCQKESRRSLLRHGARVLKCPLRPERSKPKSSEGLASMPPRTRVLRQQTVSASNRALIAHAACARLYTAAHAACARMYIASCSACAPLAATCAAYASSQATISHPLPSPPPPPPPPPSHPPLLFTNIPSPEREPARPSAPCTPPL